MKPTIVSWVAPVALLVGASGWLYVEATAMPGEWDRFGAVSAREPLGQIIGRGSGGSGGSGPEVMAFSRGSQWVVQGLSATLPGAAFERVSRPLATLVCVQATERCWRAAPVEPSWVWLGAE